MQWKNHQHLSDSGLRRRGCAQISNRLLRERNVSNPLRTLFHCQRSQANHLKSAAKTALLLDNTQLGPNSVQVSAAQSIGEIAGEKSAATAATTSDETPRDEQAGNGLAQEDKPRSRIFAEYLAHGYVISDQAIQRAIALDQKHGFSNRFTAALSNFDSKYHATDKARGLDTSYGITDKAQSGWRGLNSYFEKALDTPTGRRVRDFYIQTEKQVQDIHAEARRLADLKSGKQSPEREESSAAAAAQGVAGAGVAPSGVPTGDPGVTKE